MYISVGWLYGLMFGIEALSQGHCNEMGVAWCIVIDIGIVRLLVTYEYPDEEKPA